MLQNLHYSSNKIRIMKSRTMGWPGHETCMGVKGNAYRFLMGKKIKGKT
jgi:hypothetical protein